MERIDTRESANLALGTLVGAVTGAAVTTALVMALAKRRFGNILAAMGGFGTGAAALDASFLLFNRLRGTCTWQGSGKTTQEFGSANQPLMQTSAIGKRPVKATSENELDRLMREFGGATIDFSDQQRSLRDEMRAQKQVYHPEANVDIPDATQGDLHRATYSVGSARKGLPFFEALRKLGGDELVASTLAIANQTAQAAATESMAALCADFVHTFSSGCGQASYRVAKEGNQTVMRAYATFLVNFGDQPVDPRDFQPCWLVQSETIYPLGLPGCTVVLHRPKRITRSTQVWPTADADSR